MDNLLQLWNSSGLAQIDLGSAFMMIIGLLLLFLAIRKQFEPLLLVPIGFGGKNSGINKVSKVISK